MAIMGDARFGQWAQPDFGASLSSSSSSAPGVLPSPGTAPTSASSAFNSPDVDPNPGQDHFSGAGLAGGSWSPGQANAGSIYLADGGAIPTGQGSPQDTGDAQPAQADPFDLVQQALTYGRQKLGLPQSFFGGGSDTGDSAAPAAPSQSFAEGGAVDGNNDGDQSQGVIPSDQSDGADTAPQGGEQAQGAQGPDPKAAMAYLQGAGAMPADQALALEKQVDPSGTMDPNVRKMEAIKATGSPDKAFGLMQHYRQKFNAYNAFAKAAAQGTPQKPADLHASARAATQAYQHLPDGNDIKFNPVQGGMHVAIRNVVPKAQGKSQHFDEGGGVPDDLNYETAGAQPWAGNSHDLQQQKNTVGAIPDGSTDLTEGMQDDQQPPQETEGSKAVHGPVERALGGKSPHQMVRDFVLSIPQYLGWLSKDGQADNVLENGAEKTLAAAAAQTPPQEQEGSQQPQGSPQGAAPQQQQSQQGQRPVLNQEYQQGVERDRNRLQQAFGRPKPQQTPQQGQQGGVPDAGGLRPTPNNAEQFGSTVGKNGGANGSSLTDVLHEIDQAYPFVGMSQQRALARAAARQHWDDNRTKIEQEQTRGAAADRRAEVMAGSRRDVATTQAGAHVGGIEIQQAHGDQRNANTNTTKTTIAKEKEGGVQTRFKEAEGGRNARSVAMNQPGAIGDDAAMAKGIKSLGGAPQQQAPQRQAPQQQAPQRQAPQQQAMQGVGPVPKGPPPAGMKYQTKGNNWRLVPAQ